ncbi:MAG: MFS transporter, partial [Chloroflexota bacterium]|nr:MFS transporter [Chloroflexota bacterium]
MATDRRLLIVLCLASFLAVVNFAAPSPFFPEIARDLGTTVPLLGQVTTILTLLSALLGLGIGPLADRYGHRRLMVGGTVAVALNLLGTGLAPAYPLLLLLAVVGGLGDAVLFGLPLAIAATHFAGEARRRAVSWTSAGLPMGAVVGVPLLAAA